MLRSACFDEKTFGFCCVNKKALSFLPHTIKGSVSSLVNTFLQVLFLDFGSSRTPQRGGGGSSVVTNWIGLLGELKIP